MLQRAERQTTRSRRVRGIFGLSAVFAYGVYVVGCSSAPGQAAPLEGTLRGTYFALNDSLISEITFEDATHYSLLKSGCEGEQVDGEGDIGCTQTGTYVLDSAAGQLSLTESGTNTTTTIPFQIDSTAVGGDQVDTLGAPLTTGNGALTSGGDAGSSIVQCFSSPLTEGDNTSKNYGLHCPNTSQVSTDGILARAELWVAANVPYCQAANHAHDSDKSCASTCNRPGEPAAWDPYRSDCSGFVSWAWGLPPPGRTTGQFGDVSTSIGGNDLQPGDALVNPGTHIILFIQWTNSSHTSAVFQEEPGCSANPPHAHQYTSNVTISGSRVTVAFNRETFNAIRYNKICASTCKFNNDGGTTPSGAASTDGGSTPTTTSPNNGSPTTTSPSTTTPSTTTSPSGVDSGSSTPVTVTPPACTSDGQCNPGASGSGLICSGGNCVPGCHTNTQCPSSLTCRSGECGLGMACTNDGTCNPGGDGAGEICVSKHCTPGCHTSAQCPGNTTCHSGQCH